MQSISDNRFYEIMSYECMRDSRIRIKEELKFTNPDLFAFDLKLNFEDMNEFIEKYKFTDVLKHLVSDYLLIIELDVSYYTIDFLYEKIYLEIDEVKNKNIELLIRQKQLEEATKIHESEIELMYNVE